jgi:hypothetical protein
VRDNEGSKATSRTKAPTLARKATHRWLAELADVLRRRGVSSLEWEGDEMMLRMELLPLEPTTAATLALQTSELSEPEPDPKDYQTPDQTAERRTLFRASGRVGRDIKSRIRDRQAKQTAEESPA